MHSLATVILAVAVAADAASDISFLMIQVKRK